MCGITGAFVYRQGGEQVDTDELRRIRDTMIHRGPDDSDIWVSDDKVAGLAHQRLAVIDLSSRGRQPMASKDGKIRVVYNGMIYNYKRLRESLEKRGHSFQSDSDTEVLLHLYREKGEKMVQSLRGMYAFAIWDEEKKKLLLARDPFGIKPLYYSDNGKTIRFASQVKALLKSPQVSSLPEPAGHVGFFLTGSVPEPYTLFKGVRQLPAGCTLIAERDVAYQINPFCDLSTELSGENLEQKQSPYSPETRLKELNLLLRESVEQHLQADVPTGFFLSAGRDSATLVAIAAQLNSDNVHTVTLGFDEFKNTKHDETKLAEEMARAYQTQHQTVWLSKEDFIEARSNFLNAMDQPSIDGLNTYFVSRVAAQSGLTVAISGLGADELFGGYPSFQDVPRMAKNFGWTRRIPVLGKAFRGLTTPFVERFTSPKFASLLEYGHSYPGAYLLRRGLYMPWELESVLEPELAGPGWKEIQSEILSNEYLDKLKTPSRKVSYLESTRYMRNQLLRDTDWASMAHSLEVRVPFVDLRFIRNCVKTLGQTEQFTKEDMVNCLARPLPEEIQKRAKTGFDVPIRQWLSKEEKSEKAPRGLRGWARAVYKAYLERV